MKLLHPELYIFFIVIFIFFIIIAIFDILKPEDQVIMNYMPFPTISPKNIPGPST